MQEQQDQYSLVQQNRARQRCPFSPTLSGLFFDGLHGHLNGCAPDAEMRLASGRWVASFMCAVGVLLPPWTSSGLQSPLDSMHAVCFSLGVTISPSHPPCHLQVWPGFSGIEQHLQSWCTMAEVQQPLWLQYSRLSWARKFSYDALPSASCGCKVWAPSCSPTVILAESKDMQGIHIAFSSQLCQFQQCITSCMICNYYTLIHSKERLDSYWSLLPGFRSLLPESCLRLSSVRNEIAHGQQLCQAPTGLGGVTEGIRDSSAKVLLVPIAMDTFDGHGCMDSLSLPGKVWEDLHVSLEIGSCKRSFATTIIALASLIMCARSTTGLQSRLECAQSRFFMMHG